VKRKKIIHLNKTKSNQVVCGAVRGLATFSYAKTLFDHASQHAEPSFHSRLVAYSQHQFLDWSLGDDIAS